MKKTLLAIATAATLSVATLAPTSADAGCRGCGVGLGIVGGLAAGAIIGGALASRPAYAAPAPYYGYAPAPVYVQPRCWTERQRVWDPYAGVWRVQRVRVCD